MGLWHLYGPDGAGHRPPVVGSSLVVEAFLVIERLTQGISTTDIEPATGGLWGKGLIDNSPRRKTSFLKS